MVVLSWPERPAGMSEKHGHSKRAMRDGLILSRYRSYAEMLGVAMLAGQTIEENLVRFILPIQGNIISTAKAFHHLCEILESG
jgi:hypothetical protein